MGTTQQHQESCGHLLNSTSSVSEDVSVLELASHPPPSFSIFTLPLSFALECVWRHANVPPTLYAFVQSSPPPHSSDSVSTVESLF